MKRILAAALLAALTVPAFAFETGAPFEQTQLDRQLPNVKEPVVSEQASSGGTLFGLREDAPYEQYRIDTALPTWAPVMVSSERRGDRRGDQNFAPRCSHFPRNVTQNESATSRASSQNERRLM